MASPAAVGGGLLGAGAIGVGSAYLAGAFEGSGSLEAEVEPVNVLLSSEANFSSSYATSGWIGKEYGHYLVSPIGSQTKEDATIDNKKWWEWSYKRWQKDFKSKKGSLSDEFKDDKKINSSFSETAPSEGTSPKALNKVCEAVYQGTKDSITPEENFSGNKTKLKNDLFKYCSILGEVKTIGEASTKTYGATEKGGDSTKNKGFIAVTGNDKFWEIRNKEFYEGLDSDKKSRSKAAGQSSKFKTDSEGNSKQNIRDICGAAYKSQTSEDESYPISEINIFCVL
ncbi:hypothetical protein [Candidatus Mycoplasma haematohominis]|uniref:Uncharacterized protein n=1 Tax=Candidatus Mycoplasma haematohominis TaxID=1494318 RepID=A0A478FQ93_9MOLU|nr:hypothetical protein [Candidatus Mycoplasma haemohominis]GCE63064.1 hypothetical protein MHSWG343_00420 [Candidatus Mycoplasma haemohominis]